MFMLYQASQNGPKCVCSRPSPVFKHSVNIRASLLDLSITVPIFSIKSVFVLGGTQHQNELQITYSLFECTQTQIYEYIIRLLEDY